MTEYSLQELLQELLTPHWESGKKVYLSTPRAHRESLSDLAGEWSTFTPARGLVPWDASGQDIDRFDVVCAGRHQSAWRVPGHTRAQNQVYTTLRSDGMSTAEALNTVEALEDLTVR